MKQSGPGRWWFEIVFGLVILAMLALCVRLAFLIRTNQSEAIQMTRRQQKMVIPLPARRGNIFAKARSNYVLLAGSKQIPGCYGDPSIMSDSQLDDVAIKVSEVLGIDPRVLQDKIVARRDKGFVWLSKDISAEQAQAIRDLKLRSVKVNHLWRREYPNAELASTMMGFCRSDGVGGGGLELSQEKLLLASHGRRVVRADARRRPIWPLLNESKLPKDGNNIYLTLDAVIQGYLQDALAESVERYEAKWGTGIVVNPQTGDILAMTSFPNFDPNEFNNSTPSSRTNKAICLPYEPGSAVKPIFAAAAVDYGLIDYATQVFCENGEYRAHRGGRITDHGKKYGYLSLEDVLVLSSNIGMAKVGELLGDERQYEILGRFGFGQQTGIELPAESRGIIRPLVKWDGYSLRRVPFGQEMSATTVQLAMAFSSLANGGLLLKPQLIDHVTDSKGRVIFQSKREVVKRVLTTSTAAQSVAVLAQVVERGTGAKCQMEGWTSFGKTGTAQIPGIGGYTEGAYVGTFIGGAPVNDTKLMCIISIYWPDRSKGYYGSVVAAPYVREVLEKALTYMEVPPDKKMDFSLNQ